MGFDQLRKNDDLMREVSDSSAKAAIQDSDGVPPLQLPTDPVS